MKVSPPAHADTARLPAIDILRGIAVVGMFGYHLTWDLAHFGFIDRMAPFAPTFRLYSHTVASSFMALAGASLVLARREPFRWDRWARHIVTIVVAALAVTAASALFFPEGLIGFGILHCIALALLVATPFLFLPPLAALAVACLIAGAPSLLRNSAFDTPLLIWTGLGTIEPSSNDYRPFFPWAAPTFVGLAVMAMAVSRGALASLARWQPLARFWRLLAWGGRHSLAIYLLHQPLFFGALAGLAMMMPPERSADRFSRACVARCIESAMSRAACAPTCACVARDLAALGLLDRAARSDLDSAEKLILSRSTQSCLRQAP